MFQYLPMTQASYPFFLLLITITVTLLHCTLIAAAAASPLVTPTSTANLTASGNLQCIDSPDWVTTAFQAYDCFTAIAFFEDYEVYRHSTTLFEFLSSTLHPSMPMPQFTRTTPRKYTYKSCTMAIVMLCDLPDGLPGLPPSRRQQRPKTDLADFVVIGNAALNVRDGCLSIVSAGGGGEGGGGGGGEKGEGGVQSGNGEGGRVGFVNPVGYDTAGMNGAIGVFLWDTNSVINQAVKEGGVGNMNTNMNVNVNMTGLGRVVETS